MPPVRRLVLPLVVALLAAAAPASAKVKVSTNPALQPSFRSGASDYASRCVSGTAVRVSVHASGGDRVSVAHRESRGGDFVESVKRRPGAAFSFKVTRDGHGKTYHVRCLPGDFPGWTIERHGTPQAQWYVTAPIRPEQTGYVAIFDSNGAPVWWYHTTRYTAWDAKLLANGHLAWTRNIGNHFGVEDYEAYEEHKLDGHRVRLIRAVGNATDTHDLQRLPNGNYLVIAYRPRNGVDMSSWHEDRTAKVFDGEVQEITPDGKRVWRWSSRGHIDVSETTARWRKLEKGIDQSKRPPGERGIDYAHLNSVEPDGDGLILSFRHLDAVYRIDRKTGEIDWKLGGRHVPGESLAVRGVPKGESVFGGQHDARLWTDGTLTVHDNGSQYERPPAAVRFRIDTAERTATRIEHVTEPNVFESRFVGSARKLPSGNWVVSWGGSPIVTEQKPGGAIVLALGFADNSWSYRAQPIPRHVLSAGKLRHGMDRMAKQKR